MKKVASFIGLLSLFFSASAQNPTKEFEIESILVDACNFTSVEPNNEMLVFKVGPNPIDINNLSVAGQLGAQTYTVNNWPTVGSAWNGLIQNAATATVTAALQSTITNGCGKLIEPPAGIIPAYASVLMVTSTTPSTTDNSFASLTDSLYIIYHNATYTVTTGHFKNSPCIGTGLSATPCTYTAAANRGFILMDNITGAADTVTYDITLLTNTVTATPYGGSTGQNDGATVRYAWPGFPTSTYENQGCKAPFIPLSASASPTNTTVCNGTGADLTGTAGGTYTSTVWSGGSGSFSNPNSLNTTYNPGPSDNGVVTLTLTVNGKCMGAVATATVAVTVNNPPIPSISSSNGATICSGTSTTLSVTSTGTLSTTYTWSPGSSNGSTFPVTPAVGANVYTVDAGNACGALSTTYTVNVNPLPVLTVMNDTICRGATDTLTASGAASYTWSTSAITSTITASPNATAQYSVSGTDANGCVGSASAEIYVYSLPTLSVSTMSVCPGATATLTASGASTFTWSTNQTGASISVTPSAPSSTYTVTGTDAHACVNFTTATASVYTPPNVNVPNTSVCPSGTVNLTASGAQTYTWSPAATLSASTGVSVVASPTTLTVYTITGTDAATGCVGTNTFTVSISATPNISINPASACPGSTTTLTATGASANSYTWSTSQTGASTVTVTAGAGTYSVVGANSSGCLDTAYTTITLLPGPATQNITGFPVICAGQTDLLSAVPGGSGYTYTWSGPSGSLGNGNTALANQSGTYTLVTSNACGQVSTTFSVLVSSPVASFSPNTTVGTAPATFTFTNSSNGTGLSSYWNFANGDSSQQVSPVETYTTGGTYNVALWVVDTYGCVDSTHVTVFVTDSVAVVIPNIFSPNGDGINDVFSVKGMGISSFNCKIYDRWGVSLYEWSNINGGWDGKSSANGNPASDGTYYFLISYTTANNKTTTKPGFLQLVR